MTKNARVFNVTRGYSMKHAQAVKAVEACSCAWVEFGQSVRDLTLAESIAARNKQAQMREPLDYAELPGIMFRLGDDRSAVNREMALAYQAQQFFEEAVTA